MSKVSDKAKALLRAIELAGSQEALAQMIGCDQTTVSTWLKKSKKGVSAEFAPRIENSLRGAVTKEQLRPDLFGEFR